MHDYHDALPGFSPDQILYDGCGECEERSQRNDHGLSNLDSSNFLRAWARAIEWNRDGLSTVSHAEAPLLNMLWSVQLHFERLGIPLGMMQKLVQS